MKVLAAIVLLAHPVLFATDAAFPKHAIATVHPLATQAGQQAFEKGGNAIDAAAATGLALAAVEPWNSGLGGIGFMLVTGSVEAIYAMCAEWASLVSIEAYQVLDNELALKALKG